MFSAGARGEKIMSQVMNSSTSSSVPSARIPVVSDRPTYQAFAILYAGFVALPVIAGADKFCHVLTEWTQYLAPVATRIIPVADTTFMQIVGVVEILAGVLVAFLPRYGSYVVAA